MKKIYALILALAMALSLVACGGAPASEPKQEEQTTAATSSASSAVESVEDVPEEEPEPEQEEPSATGEGDLGDFHVKIKGARMDEDYEGKPVIVVSYEWTNNSADTISPMSSMMEEAFQDGVQMERAIVAFDYADSMKEVRPGTTIDVDAIFNTTSENTVEFELSEFISFSDEKVTMDFEPSQLG